MFVIDDKGVLVYAGAIDDNPSSDAADARDREELRARRLRRGVGREARHDRGDGAVRLRREVQELVARRA
jgi:hypothetical protein